MSHALLESDVQSTNILTLSFFTQRVLDRKSKTL